MNKKLQSFLTIVLLTIFSLSACSDASPTASDPVTDTAAPTGAIPATEAPAPAPTIAATATDAEPSDNNTEATAATSENVTTVDDEGNTSIDATVLEDALAAGSISTLSESERNGLLFMREEEKLARDVYLVFYDQWNMQIFQNISNSEQTHTDAVLRLIERFGLEDPVTENEIGVFENEVLQTLYDQLITSGSLSLVEALKVGAAIEEIDILDLEKYIAATENTDILLVYENLLKGSRNHLRAFTSNIERQSGESYQPQYMSQTAYDAIILADMETGGNGKNGGNGGGGNGNGGSGGNGNGGSGGNG